MLGLFLAIMLGLGAVVAVLLLIVGCSIYVCHTLDRVDSNSLRIGRYMIAIGLVMFAVVIGFGYNLTASSSCTC